MDEHPPESKWEETARRRASYDQMAMETERANYARAEKRQWSGVDELIEEAERDRIRGAHPRLTDENFGAIVRHGDGGNVGDLDVGIDWF